jgi:hypothetical protein
MASEQLKIELTAIDKTMAAFNSVNNSLTRLSNFTAKARNALATIGVAFAASQFANGIKNAADRAENFANSAQKIGSSVEFISSLSYAAKLANVEFDSLEKGMIKFSRAIDEASSNAKSGLAFDFQRIGINLRDTNGQLKPTSDLFLEIADRISSYGDGARKAAVAQAIFGKSGADLIPLLNLGAQGIKELQSQADALGITFSGSAGDAANSFNDQLDILSMAADGFMNRLMSGLVPSLMSFAQQIGTTNNNTQEFNRTFSGLKPIAEGLAMGFRGVVAAVFMIGSAFVEVGRDISAFIEATKAAASFDFQEANKIIADRISQQKDLNTIWSETKNVFNGVSQSTDALNILVTKNTKVLRENGQATAGLIDKYRALGDPTYQIRKDIDELNQLFKSGALTQSEYSKALEKLTGDLAIASGGWAGGMETFRRAATDVSGAINQAFSNAFSSMEDAFVKFVQTGKLDFKSLTDSIIADLARIAFRQMMSGLLGGLNLGSFFGLGQTSAPMLGHAATGGNIPYGRPTLVGEKGMEIFTPSSGGRVTPNNQLGGSNVNVNVINNSNSQATTRETTDGRGNRSIEVVIGDAVAKQIGQIGSSVNQSLRNTFNSAPALVGR